VELHDDIVLDDVKIEQYNGYPSQDGPGCVLVISARLTSDIADTLRKKDFFFDAGGVAREFDGAIKLGESMREVELRIPPGKNSATYCPIIIRKFSVMHSKAAGETDITLRMTMKAHFAGAAHVKDAFKLFFEMNKTSFRAKIEPKQGALFSVGEPEEEEAIAR
jgi:hypothetical protein